MNENLTLLLAGVAGGVLGAMFFGGLWLTVRHGLRSSQPAIWFVGSLMLRTGIVLAGFLAVSGGRWERLAVCLIGFIAARVVVTWVTRPMEPNEAVTTQEASSSH